MSCDETRTLLHGYVDGELDLVRSLEIEQHLRDCAGCSEAHQNLQELRESLRRAPLYHRPGAHLKQRIQSALGYGIQTKRARRPAPWRGLAIAASLAAAALLTAGIMRLVSGRSGEDLLAHQVVASHARSIMAPKPIDEESSNHHVLKPWLNTKRGFSPDVADAADKPGLEEQRFHLKGARVDYLDDRLVAALVYKRDEHLINVYVWPAVKTRTRL